MYNPDTECGANFYLYAGFTCISTSHPNGANGYELYVWGPYKCAYDDMFRTIIDCLSKFNVNSACRNRWSHKLIGKLSSMPHSIDTKWFLKVWISFSAMFLQ